MGLETFIKNYLTKWNVTKRTHETGTIRNLTIKADLEAFLDIMNNPIVKDVLNIDICYTLADKYLIAMAFIYFQRACIPRTQYNAYNFFLALYLAHDMEEDDEEEKQSIFPWLFMRQFSSSNEEIFQAKKFELWKAMDYRAYVSLNCCKKVMDMAPESDVWKRERDPAHGGALRPYSKDPKCKQCLSIPSNPFPLSCPSCSYILDCNGENERGSPSKSANEDDESDVIDDLFSNDDSTTEDEEYIQQPFKKIREFNEE